MCAKDNHMRVGGFKAVGKTAESALKVFEHYFKTKTPQTTTHLSD